MQSFALTCKALKGTKMANDFFFHSGCGEIGDLLLFVIQRLCIDAALSYKTFRSSQIVEAGPLMILLISNKLKKCVFKLRWNMVASMQSSSMCPK